MNVELEGTDRVCDVLDRVRLSVSVVIHRIDAPLVTCTVVMGMDDTIEKRVTEKHVRMSHVNLRTKALLTVSILSGLHVAEKLEVLLYASVTVWAFRSRHLDCSTTCADLLLSLVIHISQSLLYKFLSPLIELVEIVRSITLVLPLETEPLDVLLDGVNILGILLDRVCIVEAEVGLSAVFLGKAEIDADTLRMSDVKISVRFRRETCHYGFTLAACEISFYDLLQKVEILDLSHFLVYLFHMVGRLNLQIIGQIYGFFNIVMSNMVFKTRDRLLSLQKIISTMENIALRQVHFGGVTVQVPEIWDVETEEMIEEDGQKSFSISIGASGKDVRSVDISFGPMPEESDAYTEACGTYEEIMAEEDLEANDEPILCFGFQDYKAYGFSLATDDGLPCFFFCIDVPSGDRTNLLTMLLCAKDNEELQSLLEFMEEYISAK